MANEKMKNIVAIQLLLEVFVSGEIDINILRRSDSRQDAYMFLRDNILITGPHILDYITDKTATKELKVTSRGECWLAAMRNLPLPVKKTVFEIPEQI